MCALILQTNAQWVNLHAAIEPCSLNMSRKKPENLSFEEALSELEDLVDRLEQGEISLEESLKSFERGIALTRNCQQALVKAEQKVSILSEKTLDAEPETFEVDAKD